MEGVVESGGGFGGEHCEDDGEVLRQALRRAVQAEEDNARLRKQIAFLQRTLEVRTRIRVCVCSYV